jgi:hypothetical protein
MEDILLENRFWPFIEDIILNFAILSSTEDKKAEHVRAQL